MKICPQCQTQFPDDIDFCSNDGMKLRAQREDKEDPMLGKVLDGRWIIDSKLGEGGMGSVYLGRQRSVNRAVAIKTLRPELVTNDEFVDRFFREAQIATTINHPNCVTILDFGQAENDLLFLAMEYLEGMPLSDRLEEGPPLTLDEILTIGDEIAAALEAAHSHGIIHRDLKPDNVFLQKTPNGGMHSKLLDFGIAKDSNASTQFTRTGQIFGTPDYMSPEQCSGSELDGRSDLYSLGCIFYEMLCGRPPFENANSMAILMAHVTERPRPLSELTSLPLPVEQLVLRLLSKEPDARHADASALRKDLMSVRATLFAQGTGQQPVVTAPRTPVVADAFADTMAGEALSPPKPTPTPAAPRQPTASVSWDSGALDDDPPIHKPSKLPLIAGVLIVGLLVLGGGAFALSSMLGDNTTQDTPDTSSSTAVVSSQDKDTTPPESDSTPPSTPPEVGSVPEDKPPTDENTRHEEGLNFDEPIKEEDVAEVTPPEDDAKPADTKKSSRKKTTKKATTTTKTVATKIPPKKLPGNGDSKSSTTKKTTKIRSQPPIEKKFRKFEKKIEKKSDKIVNDLFK